MNRQHKFGIDRCVIAFLCVAMISRIITEDVSVIAFFSVISLGVAIYDVYDVVEKEYRFYERFYIVRGGFIVGAVISTILIGIIAFFKTGISNLLVDELSILALLVSIPKDYYCYLLGRFIVGNEVKEIDERGNY